MTRRLASPSPTTATSSRRCRRSAQTFSGIALTGGAIGNSGTLNISGPSTLANTTLSGGQVTLDVPLPGLAATDPGTVVQFTGSGFDAARVFKSGG